MGIFLLAVILLNILFTLFMFLLFAAFPSFITSNSDNTQAFRMLYFKAIQSIPLGFILGTALACAAFIAQHPNLKPSELNLWTVWFGNFYIVVIVTFVVGLLSQLIAYFSKMKPSSTTTPPYLKEPTP